MHRSPPILRRERAATVVPARARASGARSASARGWLAGLLVSLVVGALVAPAAASAAGTLDQQHTDTSGGHFLVGNLSFARELYRSAAQTFTAGVSGRLDRVDLPLEGGVADPLIVEIRDTSTGGAPGAVLASASVPASNVPDQGLQWTAITFDAPVGVQAGTRYAIVAYTTDEVLPGYQWGVGPVDTDTYAGGATWSSTSDFLPPAFWIIPYNRDLAFKTYVTPPDATAPTTAIALDPAGADGERGWYVSDPRATVVAADEAGGSGVAETRCVLDPAVAPSRFDELPAGCDYTGLGADVGGDGEHVLYAAAKDHAGNAETPVRHQFKLDATAPSVTYSGNQGIYDIDATVDIACQASDAVSGINAAATACASIHASAHQLAIGTNQLTATATDVAGNSAAASTSFEVRVTAGGLCALTTRFVRDSARYHALTPAQRAGVDRLAAELCGRLSAIIPQLTPAQKTALVRAYKDGVSALVAPGWLTADQATTLRRLADQL